MTTFVPDWLRAKQDQYTRERYGTNPTTTGDFGFGGVKLPTRQTPEQQMAAGTWQGMGVSPLTTRLGGSVGQFLQGSPMQSSVMPLRQRLTKLADLQQVLRGSSTAAPSNLADVLQRYRGY